MKFKNDRQRRAMFAKMSNAQLKSRGIQLKPYADNDKDGIVNKFDCRPLNPKQQGIIHNWIKSREKKMDKKIKVQQKQAEKQQDELLKKTDLERTKLNKHLELQEQLLKNKKAKQDLSELKKANFYQSTTGKIVATGGKSLRAIGKGLTSPAAKNIFRKVFANPPKAHRHKRKKSHRKPSKGRRRSKTIIIRI